MNGVNQLEEMVTGAGRGQGNRVRLQKLFLLGTASLRTQTYLRSSLLSTHFGEEKPRPGISGRLNFHWVDLNKPLSRVSLALLMRGVVMVHMVDSYESFQLFKFKLCTMH